MDSKDTLHLSGTPLSSSRQRKLWVPRLLRLVTLAAVISLLHCFKKAQFGGSSFTTVSQKEAAKLCPQTDPLWPSSHSELYSQIGSLLETEDYKLRAAEWLGGAVREPTESYDGMGAIGEDPRWETFGPFHQYLEKVYPLM